MVKLIKRVGTILYKEISSDFIVDALIDAFCASKANKTKELGKGVDNEFLRF